MLLAVAAALAIAPAAGASLGRVVAVGDSMASGMGLGPILPMLNPACGRTSGSYPELALARLSPSSYADVTCNGGHTGVFTSTNPGLNIPENNGVTIPAQYDSLDGSEQAIIVGTGGNEAYFGEVAFACLGYQADLNVYISTPQGQTPNYANNCKATYGATGSGILPKVNNSESLVGPALDAAHQKSPNAKIFLVGIPRIVTPDGAGCMPNPILTPTDAPVYAVWEDQLRLAMKRVVAARSSWATYVDVQQISGTSHTMCAASWSDKWVNPWSVEPGVTYPGIALHNTPAGANAMANAIIDSFHATGLDTGTQAVNATNPVVSISAPANNSITKNSSVTVNYTATDNSAVSNCSVANGASVALSAGTNTITVTCYDYAGNSGQASVTVTRDSTPPQVSIDSPADGTNTTASSIPLNYTASDNLGTPTCTPASGSSRPLNVGANTLTVSCTDSAGNAASASVTVNRGSVPVVAISSPANGFSTTSATVNVAYTVGGSPSIPANTTCTVNGSSSSSASSNTVSLSVGSNPITVNCANQFGSGTPASISVTGSPPSAVAITSPSEGFNTTASSVNVAFTVSGSSTIPGGTTCTVNSVASSDANTNSVTLSLGSNTITVTCTGAFGSKSESVHVNRGNPPVVAISSPANGSSTAATSTNVAYTVDGAASIPGGTSCTVGGANSSSATTNNFALSVGPNTITVVCTSQFGQGTPASASVTRGIPPVVAISSPANNTNTTSSSINVAYTVNGNASIPGGTTCTVGGSPSASATTNSSSLSIGGNLITVACSNTFGAGTPATVTVNRGSVPVVAITSPADNTSTSATSINVAYTVNGAASIPDGTTCTAGGNPSASATTNSVSLLGGNNTVTVICTNAFGAGAAVSVVVIRGAAPTVAISSPANGANTTASSINVAYTINGSASIPGGTTCSVAGAPSSSTSTNSIALTLGANSISATCTNTFGTSTPATVTVNRGNPPVVAVIAPSNGTATSSATTNVAFTVDGAGSIPAGASCTVGGASTSSATTNAVALAIGSNSITVACTTVFGSASSAVTVTRGSGPAVVITAPANGLKTVSAQVNVAFTVDGSGTIPGGTSCTVSGQSTTNTATNSVALALGVNAVSVKCVNGLGEDTKTVAVTRGTAPALSVASPANGLNTIASSVDVEFAVAGSGDPTCTVNGSASGSPANVPLDPGANVITVVCTSDFGTDTRVLTVNRGLRPVVFIAADAHTDTTAKTVNATYSVDGASTIPSGTTCKVNGAASTDPLSNSINLAPGENTVSVTCTNAFGDGTATVFVNYTPPAGPPGEPTAPAAPSSVSVNFSGSAKLKPARSGGMFVKTGGRGGLVLKIKLDVASQVQVSIERLPTGKSKKVKSVGSGTLALIAGTSTPRLSGRAGNRALAAGRYRVRVIVPGTKLNVLSKTFKITR